MGHARTGQGLQSFTWMVNTDMARVGYGGTFDILMHSDFHKRDYWGDYNTYEAQLVAEIESSGSVIFEWLSTIR